MALAKSSTSNCSIKDNFFSKHFKKEGTPTMGGLIFIIPTVLVTLFLLVTGRVNYTSNLGAIIGFN